MNESQRLEWREAVLAVISSHRGTIAELVVKVAAMRGVK